MSAGTPVQQLADGDVAILRLDDGKANAMSVHLLRSLVEAIDQVEASGARGIVVTGNRKAFCAGLALPDLIELDRDAMAEFIDSFARAMRRLLVHPGPTAAAINGHAIAGGCVLALMCDARVMTSAPAKIGLNEVQIGIGLPAIVIEPLRWRLPPASQTTIALQGLLVEPEAALRLGVVDELVDPDTVPARATARCRELISSAPAAYAQVKAALLRPVLEALDRHEAAQRDAWLDTWFSDEAQHRLRATVDRLRKRA